MKRALSKMIGTHSGSFHCDEALGVALLRRTKQFSDAKLLRSRDPAKLADCDIVIDVGGVYDPKTHRYDHHQRGFTETFGHGFDTKLSSAGLVFKHFGKEIISSHLVQAKVDNSDDLVHNVWLKMYKTFVEALDGIDNGLPLFESKFESHTDLSSRVGKLNPTWLEEVDDDERDRRFLNAVALTGKEFDSQLDFITLVWLPARSIVQSALDKRTSVDPSGCVLKLDRYCPWKEHLFEIEEERKIQTSGDFVANQTPLYVLFRDNPTSEAWRIAAVPLAISSFALRKSLPAPWRGLRDGELDKATGVEGGVFVHASGFIGGYQPYEAALEVAVKAVHFKEE